MTSDTNAADTVVRLRGGAGMPVLGFGTWQAMGREAYDAVLTALAAGYRHIDTATGYANEAEVGRAIRDSGVPRDDIFITTKLPPDHAGRERRTIGESLRALGVDRVDLWLIHWPPRGRASPRVWQEVLRARDDGLARDVGVSNYSIAQLDELIDATGEAPAVNQIPWSPWQHAPGTLAETRGRGVVLEGYSPFRGSDLSDPVLAEIAQRRDARPAQVILRWHVQHGVVVIPKSVTPERIRSNADIFGFSLTDEEMRRIDGLSGR